MTPRHPESDELGYVLDIHEKLRGSEPTNAELIELARLPRPLGPYCEEVWAASIAPLLLSRLADRLERALANGGVDA